MCFKILDEIFHIISKAKYDDLCHFDIEDIKIVQKLKFPCLKLDILNQDMQPTAYLKDNRSNSTKFRTQLIELYKNCAMTNINNNLCDAAHILPYSECIGTDRYDINNGILLCKNMHAAFDKNYFTIDETTCKVKILYDNFHDINIDELDLEKNKDTYIKQLDNPRSKEFLYKRNNKID